MTPIHEVPGDIRRRLAPRLLSWFARHQRDLPWRRSRDPYRIWVSEVMLQQTQVATVVGYFERFLQRFPSLADLAAAEEQEVLRHWQGLGYYRRARDLLAAARLLHASHAGEFPDDVEALTGLPGLGEYTRNAVLSQAFDRRLPILEVNSARVLSRVLLRPGDPRKNPARRQLWADAEAVLPRKEIGQFNQALMELGALVCTPKRPSCEACPLNTFCQAHREGVEEAFPQLEAKPAITEVREVAVVIRRGDEVLFVQRTAGGRWASMWEFPHAEVGGGETVETAARRLIAEMTGIEADLGRELMTLRHGITRYRVTMTCLEATYRSGEFTAGTYAAGEWLAPSRLGERPVSSPQRRLVGRVREGLSQGELF